MKLSVAVYVRNYAENKRFGLGYRGAKNQDQYYRINESRIMLFEAAERNIRQMGIDPEDADRKIADAMTGFYFKTNLGRSFNHILEMPLFVSSVLELRRVLFLYSLIGMIDALSFS